MICAFTALHPEAQPGLARIRGIEFVQIKPGDDQGYALALRSAWEAGRGFINIEQDMGATQRHVNALERCSEAYCVFAYNGPGFGAAGDPLITIGLGVVKFSTALIEELPNLWTHFSTSPGRSWVGKAWAALDARIVSALRDNGKMPHVHMPPVEHHHHYRGHCACDREHAEYPVDREGRYDPTGDRR